MKKPRKETGQLIIFNKRGRKKTRHPKAKHLSICLDCDRTFKTDDPKLIRICDVCKKNERFKYAEGW